MISHSAHSLLSFRECRGIIWWHLLGWGWIEFFWGFSVYTGGFGPQRAGVSLCWSGWCCRRRSRAGWECLWECQTLHWPLRRCRPRTSARVQRKRRMLQSVIMRVMRKLYRFNVYIFYLCNVFVFRLWPKTLWMCTLNTGWWWNKGVVTLQIPETFVTSTHLNSWGDCKSS